MTDRQPAKEPTIAERGYQFRFLLVLSAIFAGGALLLFIILFLFFSRPISGDYSSVFFALRHLTEFTLPMVSFSALVYVLLVCGATSVLCVYSLHKVAGPLYRMGRVLESYVSGTPARPVSFRAGDQASVLATSFNTFLARLQEDRKGWIEVMDRAEQPDSADPDGVRRRMEKAVKELSAAVSRYRPRPG